MKEFGLVISAMLAVFIIVAAIFAATVGLSGIVGKGNAHITKNSSTNRIGQNSLFFDLKTDYDATVNKISVFAGVAKDNPTDTQAQIDLSGVRSHCLDVVGQYDAASGKYISKDFKDAGLPVSLDPDSCKE